MHLRRSPFAVLAAVPVIVLAACGNLDSGDIERTLTKQVEKRTHVKVKSVTCPDDIKAKKGDRFTCTITAENGATVKAQVVQQDNDGSVLLTGNLNPLVSGGK